MTYLVCLLLFQCLRLDFTRVESQKIKDLEIRKQKINTIIETGKSISDHAVFYRHVNYKNGTAFVL